jgi:elongation factor P
MHTQSRKMAYLYSTEDEVVLMDNESYEQVSVSPVMAEDALKWVVENMEVDLFYLNGVPFEVQAPNFVELLITRSDPGVQGNTAQGATKPATLESGATVQVPLFIEEGERVKVDTRTGEYLGRA